MTVRRLILAGAIFLVGGCAGSYGVSDRDVARLPAHDRQQIMTASKSINVAQSNLETARLQLDDARQFRKIALNELEAARARLEAARGGIELGRSLRDEAALRNAQRAEDAARDQLIANRAKLDYADRLVALRQAKVDEAEAQVALARADVADEKARLLEKENLDAHVQHDKIQRQKESAAERLAETRARVAMLAGEVQQLRVAWQDCRNELNTAALDTMPPPRSRRTPPDPRGDVNDTPNAPENPDSQEPTNNIAPNP